jgi:large subunit ribosomal protein L31
MKKNKHPEYVQVLFEDSSTGHRFVCGAAMKIKEKATHEGKEYPIYRAPISSSSHPYFNGGNTNLGGLAGQIQKFQNKYGKKKA